MVFEYSKTSWGASKLVDEFENTVGVTISTQNKITSTQWIESLNGSAWDSSSVSRMLFQPIEDV